MRNNNIARALICGVTGQDGAYLSKFLLNKNYEVWGSSRDIQASKLNNLHSLGIHNNIKYISLAPNDFHNVFTAISKIAPDEIYYIAGQSSVGLSFAQPVEALESITLGTLNILESVRLLGIKSKIYHASSSECFGNLNNTAAIETTQFMPRSPYAIAKASAHWLVINYREAYGLFASNGILFNHESPLRPERFVTQKIIRAANRISLGSNEILELGRIDIYRDWGWAPEYVDAMWRILQADQPDDYIVATGEALSLQDFVEHAFSIKGLDWREHVRINSSLYRPDDIAWSCGDASKAKKLLGWEARIKGLKIIEEMSIQSFTDQENSAVQNFFI